MGDTPNLDTLLAMRPGAFAAVHERLDTAYDSTKRIIAANRETVLLLTDLLLERRLLLPGEVADIVSGINRSETIYPTIS
jgi:ATP-dependent Zn protease